MESVGIAEKTTPGKYIVAALDTYLTEHYASVSGLRINSGVSMTATLQGGNCIEEVRFFFHKRSYLVMDKETLVCQHRETRDMSKIASYARRVGNDVSTFTDKVLFCGDEDGLRIFTPLRSDELRALYSNLN